MFLKYLSTNFLTHPPTLVSETRDLSIFYTEFITAATQLNPDYKPIDENLRICKNEYLAASDSEKNAIDMAFSELTNCLQHFQSLQGFPELATPCHNIMSNLLLSPSQMVIKHGLFVLQTLNFIFKNQTSKLEDLPFKIQWNVYSYLWTEVSSNRRIKILKRMLEKNHFSSLFHLIHEEKGHFDFLNRTFKVLYDFNVLLWKSHSCLEAKVFSSFKIDTLTFFISCDLWHQITESSKSKLALFFLEPLHLSRLLTFHQNVQNYLENSYPDPIRENSQKLNETLSKVFSSKMDQDIAFKTQFLTLLQQSPSLEDAIFLSIYVNSPPQTGEE